MAAHESMFKERRPAYPMPGFPCGTEDRSGIQTKTLQCKEKPNPARGAVQPHVGRPWDGGIRTNIQRKETCISDTGSPGSFLDEKMLCFNYCKDDTSGL